VISRIDKAEENKELPVLRASIAERALMKPNTIATEKDVNCDLRYPEILKYKI